MKSISRFFIGTLIIGAFVIPQVSSATTSEEFRTQIQALLDQVKVLQGELVRSNTASSTSPLIVCRDLKRNLQFGDRGEEVKLLQEMLTKAGYRPETDGTFGEETGAAVSGFQQEYKNEVLSPVGLAAPTGFVGNLTRAKLNAVCKRPPTTSPNAVCAQPPMPPCREGVACIQSFPALTTYPNEEAAKAAGATILHKGPCTEVEAPIPGTPPSPYCKPIGRNLSPGNTGEEVKILQTFLTEQGIPVEATGYFGRITANAVARFQEKYREEVLAPAGLSTSTGIVGSLTRAKINKICPVAPPITGNEVCAQPPMPICPEGRACPQLFPAPTTYPNEETAKVAGATILYKGMCKVIAPPFPPPIISTTTNATTQ